MQSKLTGCESVMGLSLVPLCFSCLDLKRKGIGDLFGVETVQLGCDSRNNAGNKAVSFTECATERRALQGKFRVYTV